MQTIKRLGGLGLALALGVTLAGCADSAPADNGTSGDAGSTTALEGQCGQMPDIAPGDPDGVIAALSDDAQALYNGYPYDVTASAWADWAPEGDGDFTVGVVFGPLRNAHQTTLYDTLVATLEASPLVSNVIATTTTGDDASAQIQQYNAVIQQGADLIVYQPVSADAFVAAVDEAAAQGIPSVAAQARVDTPNSVNVNPNSSLGALQTMTEMMQHIGGEGSILGVHGVPAFSADIATFEAVEAVLADCPGVEMVGEVTGNFDATVAKTEVLSFLSTYPGEIDGVVQTAVMAPGVISAFVESGMDVPMVTDIGAQTGSLSWWQQNIDAYTGVGIGQGSAGTGEAIADVALGMLAGGGVKASDVVLDLPVITADNLGEWTDGSADLNTMGNAAGPDGLKLVSDDYLAEVFNNPVG